MDLTLENVELGLEPTAEDTLAFAACERLLLGLYRLGEHGRGHDEFAHFTDDFVLEMERGGRIVLALHGRDEVIAWYEKALAVFARHPRVHTCTNFVWSRTSESEVRAHHLLTYFHFDPVRPATALSPSLVNDCVQTFRRDAGRWRLARRFYRILHITLDTSELP